MNLFFAKTYYYYIGNIQVKDTIKLNSIDLEVIFEKYHEVAFVNFENKEMRLDNLTLSESLIVEKENLSNENFNNITAYSLYFIPNIPQPMDIGAFRIMRRFHHTFYNEMYDYISSSKFKNVLIEIGKERLTNTIFPDMENQLNVFSMSLNKVKVVLIGLDPYSSADANGYAFATNRSHKPISLQKLEKGMLDDLDLSPDEYFLRNDLTHLINQGVFLLNTSLTVRKSQTKSHLHLWQDLITFTIKTINQISNRQIVFMFFGADALKNSKLITRHLSVFTEHPAKSSYEQRDFIHGKIFSNTNKLLLENKKKEIQWLEKKAKKNE